MTAVAVSAARRPWQALLIATHASAVSLVVATLFQAPIVDLVSGQSRSPVRAVDVAWLFFLATAVPVLVIKARRHELRIPKSVRLPLALLAAYAAVALVSLIWVRATYGADGFTASGIRAARLVVLPILALWIATSVTREMGWILAAIAGVAALAGLEATWFWLTDEKVAIEGGRTVVYGVTRAAGPFGHFYSDGTARESWASPGAANVAGLWLAVGASLALAFICGLDRSTPTLRWRYGIGALLLVAATVGLFATHSRESWLAALVTCTALLIITRHRVSGLLRRTLGVAVPLFVVAAALAVPSVNSRVRDTITPGTFSFESGPQARVDSWHDGLQWGWDRFPIGWGIGGVAEHADRFGRSTAENVFLQSWAELGLVGILILLTLCASMLRRSGQAVRQSPSGVDVMPAALTLAVFTAFAVHGVFGNTIGDPSVQVLLAVAVGALATQCSSSGVPPG